MVKKWDATLSFFSMGIITLSGFFLLFLLVRYSIANYPKRDDYYPVWAANKFGVWGYVENLYKTINGRVGSNLLMVAIVKTGWLYPMVKVMPFV